MSVIREIIEEIKKKLNNIKLVTFIFYSILFTFEDLIKVAKGKYSFQIKVPLSTKHKHTRLLYSMNPE